MQCPYQLNYVHGDNYIVLLLISDNTINEKMLEECLDEITRVSFSLIKVCLSLNLDIMIKTLKKSLPLI
jgi:hypothetical protein